MSDTFASMCGGDGGNARVMSEATSNGEVNTDGIWGKTEFVRLKRNDGLGRVDQINLVQQSGKFTDVYWRRPEEGPQTTSTGAADSVPAFKRDDDDDCGLPELQDPGAFDVGGQWPVPW